MQGISEESAGMVVAGKEFGTARASVTEEPDAGKPHVRICMGGSSQGEFLPCLREKAMTSTDKNHAIYLDHIFVLTEPGAEVADQLVQMGLVEGTRNNHPGQGTSNRRFFLNNFTIELLYISDATEAKNGAGKNLNLYSRSDDPNLNPFGIISRVTNPGSVPEFRSWEYYPDFFNLSLIHI